jgi:tetratricopeptide (TPR) repeat protein
MSYEEADVHLGAALQATAAGVVRDPLFRVHVLHNLGVSQYGRGNYSAALECFERAAREGQDVADQKWLASLYAAMGMSRRQVGDFESAVNWLRKSEALFESLNNRSWVAEIKFETARTLYRLGNRTKAKQILAEALDVAATAGNEASRIKIQVFAAQADLEDGRPQAAVARAEAIVPEAESTGDPRLVFVARFVLARALASIDPARAERLLRQLAQSLNGADAPLHRSEVYDELGRLLAGQGRAEEALAFAQQAYAAELKSKRGGVV